MKTRRYVNTSQLTISSGDVCRHRCKTVSFKRRDNGRGTLSSVDGYQRRFRVGSAERNDSRELVKTRERRRGKNEARQTFAFRGLTVGRFERKTPRTPTRTTCKKRRGGRRRRGRRSSCRRGCRPLQSVRPSVRPSDGPSVWSYAGTTVTVSRAPAGEIRFVANVGRARPVRAVDAFVRRRAAASACHDSRGRACVHGAAARSCRASGTRHADNRRLQARRRLRDNCRGDADGHGYPPFRGKRIPIVRRKKRATAGIVAPLSCKCPRPPEPPTIIVLCVCMCVYVHVNKSVIAHTI